MSASATRRRPGAGREAELGAGISNRLVLLLAVGTGAAAANLYYAQPLLHRSAGSSPCRSGQAA